ncbi:drug exporters of the RND superfamily [Propionibacterium freudenreichii subsp. freudenreichii]|uniref:Drug exporters of the RND superfamily n=1 Tax=Propionibacterium freudenreichii subsp. freudenreichii TaxID=66712 RepID=A0A0B7NZ68_PROFF|nr:MMPL family transporter [Propionibacterium freudenreichii]CEP26083.1 drug exporters of the RND superfamily [Propionibacterium freudenreichii subsp. freudenreichii]MCT3001284.1 MMPL family transporter [Propionibacterium freudenreichii]MDK9321197.1 MMPL family transporter [Propionibacterium freudenreichii]MDK9323348.1 MMPL family transporter [Propionibacterium freudenreichii]MDK9659416.1 MMPL family transporter [Propionibacterium freudenreichii]
MAKLLYRLGRGAAHRAWAVIICWLIVLAAAGGAYAAFHGTLSTSFSIPNTETQQVADSMKQALPQASGGSERIVFTSDSGSFSDAQKTQIAELLGRVDKAEGVTGTVNPFQTADQREAQAQQLAAAETQLQTAQQQLDAGRTQFDAAQQKLTAAEDQAKAAGVYDAMAAQFQAQQAQLDAQKSKLDDSANQLSTQQEKATAAKSLIEMSQNLRTVSQDGSSAFATVSLEKEAVEMDSSQKQAIRDVIDDTSIPGVQTTYSNGLAFDIGGLGGMEVVGVAVALVVLVFMMRAILPAITPLISSLVGVGVAVTGALALSGKVTMMNVTPMLGLMIGLAVGIDYSLFILNRHRKQLLAGMDKRESIGLAVGTAGNAVVFAGSTVFIALLALNITGIPFLRVMGDVAAVAVLVAVLVAITFTPALLSLMGNHALNKKSRKSIGTPEQAAPVIRPMRTRNAVLRAVIATAVLVVIALPATSMQLGMPTGAQEPTDSVQYKNYKTTDEKFGAGVNGPLMVVATLPQAMSTDEEQIVEAKIGQQLAAQNDVAAVVPAAVSDSRTVIAFQVIPDSGPTDKSTEQLVHDLRDLSPTSDGTTLGVAGQTSMSIDVSQKLADALPSYLIVVVGLSLVILMVVFRSILVPIVATGGFVLSLFAALGATTAVYQWGWLGSVFGVHDPSPLLSFAPTIIIGVLFGLAMDYQLFLVSGMREAYEHGVEARVAVKSGLRMAAPVVRAAAIIMISVFAGFIFSPMNVIRPLGFGLAFGVLFDAFGVRLFIMPALMHLMGKTAWWLPKWLDRILPNVDVEGTSLERTHNVLVSDSAHDPAASHGKGVNPATQ